MSSFVLLFCGFAPAAARSCSLIQASSRFRAGARRLVETGLCARGRRDDRPTRPRRAGRESSRVAEDRMVLRELAFGLGGHRHRRRSAARRSGPAARPGPAPGGAPRCSHERPSSAPRVPDLAVPEVEVHLHDERAFALAEDAVESLVGLVLGALMRPPRTDP